VPGPIQGELAHGEPETRNKRSSAPRFQTSRERGARGRWRGNILRPQKAATTAKLKKYDAGAQGWWI